MGNYENTPQISLVPQPPGQDPHSSVLPSPPLLRLLPHQVRRSQPGSGSEGKGRHCLPCSTPFSSSWSSRLQEGLCQLSKGAGIRGAEAVPPSTWHPAGVPGSLPDQQIGPAHPQEREEREKARSLAPLAPVSTHTLLLPSPNCLPGRWPARAPEPLLHCSRPAEGAEGRKSQKAPSAGCESGREQSERSARAA